MSWSEHRRMKQISLWHQLRLSFSTCWEGGENVFAANATITRKQGNDREGSPPNGIFFSILTAVKALIDDDKPYFLTAASSLIQLLLLLSSSESLLPRWGLLLRGNDFNAEPHSAPLRRFDPNTKTWWCRSAELSVGLAKIYFETHGWVSFIIKNPIVNSNLMSIRIQLLLTTSRCRFGEEEEQKFVRKQSLQHTKQTRISSHSCVRYQFKDSLNWYLLCFKHVIVAFFMMIYIPVYIY